MEKADVFKIYIEQLRHGRTEKIAEVLAPTFLDIHEEELKCEAPVKVDGEAYLADDDLVLHFDVKTEVILPCSVCNGPVVVPIMLTNWYHSEPVEEIKGAVFDYANVLREALLLEVPQFAECNEGKCPQRKEIERYLAKEKGRPNPFAELSNDQQID